MALVEPSLIPLASAGGALGRAVATALVNWRLAVRREQKEGRERTAAESREIRRAARLVRLELEESKNVLEWCVEYGEWWPPEIEPPHEAWDEYGEVLAGVDGVDWEKLAGAARQLRRLRGVRAAYVAADSKKQWDSVELGERTTKLLEERKEMVAQAISELKVLEAQPLAVAASK